MVIISTSPKIVIIRICLDLERLNCISSPIITPPIQLVHLDGPIRMYDHLFQCMFDLDE